MNNSRSHQQRSEPKGVMVQLVDSSHGHTLQCWEFRDQSLLTIGRSDDRDIVIVDPYVSRNHVELRWEDGRWRLYSLGRHGVLIAGLPVGEAPLADGTVFCLGKAGPTFKFVDHLQQPKNSATLELNASGEVALRIDPAAIVAEANEIAEQDYFQQLQRHAQELRAQRPPRRL